MDRLKDQVAIVTGAGEGIGRGVVRRFASEGARVAVAELKSETGEKTAKELSELGGEGIFVRTDVSNKVDVEAMVNETIEYFGRVDILVNNAYPTGGLPVRLESKTDEDFRKAMEAGFFGTLWAMRAVFDQMRKQGGGRIINMCSLNGVNAHMYTADYNTTKEAIRCLTRSAAREWAHHNILVNAICPAAVTVAFEMFQQFAPDNVAELLKQNPIGRMGDPERDIGGVALFLASEDSCYVTGNTIFADGGGHINGVSWAPELHE
ncbi:SDR family NAD(P)-dependent oxidoreductase [Chloroflexota bacterium]